MIRIPPQTPTEPMFKAEGTVVGMDFESDGTDLRVRVDGPVHVDRECRVTVAEVRAGAR